MAAEEPRSASPPVDKPTLIYFQTRNTNLAAALIACGLMKYIRPLRLPEQGVTVFVFEDPETMGHEYERRFTHGVFPHCNPREFSATRTFLIDEVDRLSGKVRQGGRREPR